MPDGDLDCSCTFLSSEF